MEKLFPELYSQRPQESNLGFTDVLGPAFRLDNDMVNLYDYMTRPTFESDASFDYERPFLEEQLPLDWKPILAQSNSLPDYQARLGRLRQEEKDRAALAAAGWGGTFAAMAAGVLTPTALIPIAGATSTGARAIAESFALAALAATTSEAALLLNQESRTGAEAAASIGMNTVLGGIMGVGFLTLEGRFRRGLSNRFPIDNERVILETRTQEGGLTREIVPNGKERLDDSQPVTSVEDLLPPEVLQRLTVREAAEVLPGSEAPSVGLPVSAKPAEVTLPDITAGQLRAADSYLQRFEQSPAEAGTVDQFITEAFGETFAGQLRLAQISGEDFVRLLGKEYERIGLKELDDFTSVRVSEEVTDVPKSLEAREVAVRESEPYVKQSDEAIPQTSAQGLSAQVAPSSVRNTLGLKRPENRLGRAAYDWAGKLNPLTRGALQRVSPKTRDNALKLGNAGQVQDGLDILPPSAAGGTISSRAQIHGFELSRLFAALDDAYLQHIYGRNNFPAGKRSALVAQVRSQILGVPAGKLKYSEFGEEVYNALSTGKSDVAEAMQGAQAFKQFFAYFNQTHKDYLAERRLIDPEAEPMYRELAEEDFEEGVVEYAHQIWDSAKIKKNSSDFLSEFAERAKGQLQEEFAKSNERFQKRLSRMEDDLYFVQLSPEMQKARFEQVLSEIDLYAEMPEYAAVRQELADVRKQARDEGWGKEQLKAQLKDVEDNAPQSYHEILGLRKEAQKLSRNLRKLGGSKLHEAEKARAEIVRTEESLYKSLARMSNRVNLIETTAIKAGTKLDKRVKAATKTLEEAIAQLGKRNEALAKALASSRKNPVTRQRAEEMVEKSTAKVAAMRETLDIIKGKGEATEQELRTLLRLRSDVLAETRDSLRARYARMEELEERVAEGEKILDLTPEQRAEVVQTMKDDLAQFEIDFQRRWSDKGAIWELDDRGIPNFDERALELATDLQQRLTGTGELRPAGVSIIGAERGPQLRRMLKMPYEQKSKWLIKDPETVSRAFLRQMAPDLELWREFGSVNGGRMFTDLDDDIRQLQLAMAGATHVKLPKEWRLKARLLGEKARDDLAEPDEGYDFFLSPEDFKTSAAAGYEPITPKLREEMNEFVAVQHRKLTRDLGVMVQRLRHQRGVPQDSSSFMWRTGRMIKDVNVINMMGKVMISSLPDVARPVFRYGVTKTFGKSWAPMLTGMKNAAGDTSFRVYNRDLNRRLAVSLDAQLHSRASSMMDLAYDKASGLSLPERTTRFLANKMGLVAMFDLWNDGMKNVAAAVVHSTLSEYIPVVGRNIIDQLSRNGSVIVPNELKAQFIYLRRLGLQDMDIVRIAQQMDRPGAMETFRHGAKLPNMDRWNDRAAFRAYGAAVQQEVDDLIVTPGLDRPNWHDENMGYSMLAQFQSYTFTATNRIIMSGLQGNDPYLLQAVSLSLALGAVSYYTNAMTLGDKAWQDAKTRDASGVLYEAVDRSGILGVLALGTRVGEQLPYTSGLAIFGGEEQKYRRPSGLYGSIFGPTAGQVEKVADILINIDDPKQRDRILKRIHSLLPYNNVFYYQAAASRLGD